jgi:hypothetical protein
MIFTRQAYTPCCGDRSRYKFPGNDVMRNFESPEHAFGAGDVFETATPL